MEALCIVNYTYHNDFEDHIYNVVCGRVVMVENMEHGTHHFQTGYPNINPRWYLGRHESVVLREVIENE